MTNHAVDVNSPTLNGVFADIHITRRGSDWLWAVFSLFVFSTLVFMFLAFRKPATDRIFHWITIAITATASVAYFSLASDLGFAPVPVEFAGHEKSHGMVRQVFYARYIDWSITTPLLLLDLLLTAGLPWHSILFTIFMDIAMIVTGLIGALVKSRYKWGYYSLGCAFFLYIAYVLLVPARRHAKALGPEVSKTYNLCGVWLVFLWALYPVAWGVCEGANVISPDSEAVFYGVLDIFAKIGFGALLLFGHRKIDIGLLGLRMRSVDQLPGSNHHHHTSEKHGLHSDGVGASNGMNNGVGVTNHTTDGGLMHGNGVGNTTHPTDGGLTHNNVGRTTV